MVLLVDELEDATVVDFEWPKPEARVPVLEPVFILDDPLDPDDPLYVAARAAIPAGFPPDTDEDVPPWDFVVSVRLKTPANIKPQLSKFLML